MRMLPYYTRHSWPTIMAAAVLCLLSLSFVEPCSRKEQSSIITVPPPSPSTTSKPPDQTKTPTPPPVLASALGCGHSMYYTGDNIPSGTGIVGGVKTLPNQYPWIARLRIVNGTKLKTCGSALIGTSWLLTSARCAQYATMPADITAIFADWDQTSVDTGEYSVSVSNITIHNNYNPTTNDYDFALLRLTSPVNITANFRTQTICLPSSNCVNGCSPSTIAYIAGWGTTFEGGSTGSQYMQSAYVKIADRDICTSQYSGTSVPITDRMICAGWPGGGVDTCTGDSGSPLMVMEDGFYKVCGVTSFGNGCARAGYFGVYSRVCSVRSWITSTSGI